MARSTWCALAALGSGLIFCAIAAGAEIGHALLLVAAGVTELVWGLIVLRAGRIITPRLALIGCACVVAGAIAILFTGAVGAIPFLALIVLHWSTATLSAFEFRRPSVPVSRKGNRAPTFVAVLAAEALLVAAITTPALAQTEPGEFAVPHGLSHHH